MTWCSAGATASAYAEQLLRIATEMPAAGFSRAAIAMARPSKLEGRLRAILDTGRNRLLAVRTIILIGLCVGISALALATLRADDTPAEASVQPVVRWATRHGWRTQWVTHTTLTNQGGGGGGGAWREIPFSLSAEEEANARTCIQLAGRSRSFLNGKSEFPDPATRAALEAILKNRPGCFYAELLLAQWHPRRGTWRVRPRFWRRRMSMLR